MKKRRQSFYIAQIEEETPIKKSEDLVLNENPEKKEQLQADKSSTFVSPFFGRQKNKVVEAPAMSLGNKGKQYEGFRKVKKLSEEETLAQTGVEFGVLNTEQYREIQKTGSLANYQKKDDAINIKKDEIEPIDLAVIEEEIPFDQEIDIEEEIDFEEEFEEEVYIKPVRKIKKPIPKIIPRKKYKYIAPPLSLLNKEPFSKTAKSEWAEIAKGLINQAFIDFDFGGEVSGYIQGPSVTQFLISIKTGTNVKNITALEKDLLRYLQVHNIRIQDPIPGTSYAGVEVPNAERKIVLLGNLLDHPLFLENKSKLLVAMGIDIGGDFIYADIAKMPHGLIAGATNSGKSVCINSMIISMLYKNTPEELRLILIDPKMVELSSYDDIPHLAMPVVTDSKYANLALKWAVEEMDQRFVLFKSYHVKNIDIYNKLMMEKGGAILPKIVVIIDELADLMIASANEVETHIQRLTQKARAAGIHMIVATQRPSTDIIRGSIKNNILVRAAFKVASNVDSRTILDHGGAETLLGNGDMLYMDAHGERRLQGAYVDDVEIGRITAYLRERYETDYLTEITELVEKAEIMESDDATNDPLFDEVARFIVRNNTGSNNRITQSFKVSFNRADKILIALEGLGVVSSTVKGRQREVLVNEIELEEILEEK